MVTVSFCLPSFLSDMIVDFTELIEIEVMILKNTVASDSRVSSVWAPWLKTIEAVFILIAVMFT